MNTYVNCWKELHNHTPQLNTLEIVNGDDILVYEKYVDLYL